MINITKEAYGKKSKLAIVTLVGGSFHEYMATKTHPSISAYAKKCKADFLVVRSDDPNDKITWNKFHLVSLLKTYSRILYLDTDIFIRDSAQSLFKVVPSDCVGMFNELPYNATWVNTVYPKYLSTLGLSVERYFDWISYYNSGIILFSRGHEKLFSYPVEEKAFENERLLCGDQNYFNINIRRYELPIYDIGAEYNAFYEKREGETIFGVSVSDVKIMHFAGSFKTHDIESGESTVKLDNIFKESYFRTGPKHLMRASGDMQRGLQSLIGRLPVGITMAEIGSFAGESTQRFSKRCSRVYAVDAWEEECIWGISSNETSENIENRFDDVMRESGNIVKVKGRSDQVFSKFEDESLDFIYIDCCHSYAGVRSDLQNWLPKVKIGGLVGGHDYNPDKFPGVIQAVTEIFGDDCIEVFEDTSWLVKASKEKVSVLIPTFNRERYVKECIQSVQSQTHKNLDILVYDDGSTDNTVEIVRELMKKDCRIKLIDGKENRGISFARTALINACKTRLACWMDSDDICNSYRVETQLPIVRRGKNLVFSQASFFERSVNTEKIPDKFNGIVFKCKKSKKCLGFDCGNSTPCVAFPVDKSIVFPPRSVENLTGEDCDWLSEMMVKYKPILLSDVLYHHREHEERITYVRGKVNTLLVSGKISNKSTYAEALDCIKNSSEPVKNTWRREPNVGKKVSAIPFVEVRKTKPFPSPNERISVLMPVYNRQYLVSYAIQSILNQTHTNIEFLIVDDGSTDKTPEILKKFAGSDSRIKIITNKINRGIPAARNQLLLNCSSDFACWMDSDDISNIHRIKIQKNLVKGDCMVKGNAQAFKQASPVPWLKYPGKCEFRFNSLPSLMFPVKRDILCDETLTLCREDDDWYEKMSKVCGVTHISEVVYYYRLHPDRITEMKGRIGTVLDVKELAGQSYADILNKYNVIQEKRNA